MLRGTALSILPVALAAGCSAAHDHSDTTVDGGAFDAHAPADAHASLDSSADAREPADVRDFGELQPTFDCDDPTFWAMEPAHRFTVPELASLSDCYVEIPSLVLGVGVHAWGYGDFCIRVHASDRPELPLATTRIPRTGAHIGLVAPAEIDFEVRGWTFRHEEGWVVVSQRGRYAIDPPPPLRVIHPRVIELGRDATRVVGSTVVTATEILDLSSGRRRAHGALIAVGAVGDRIAWVRDESPPVIEILDSELATVGEHVWDEPFDRSRVAVLPFGVLSADRLLRVLADEVAWVELPVVIDEARPAGTGAAGRSGDQGWFFDAAGELSRGPSPVAQVIVPGEFLTGDRRVLGRGGPVGDPIDPAIGRVFAVARGWSLSYAVGESGVSLVTRGGVFIGSRTRLFVPETEGVGIDSGDGVVLVRRPDGSVAMIEFPVLDTGCE